METIRYGKMDRDAIINTLMTGGILAFPTDTVFGLGCIMEEEAILKIYAAKGRSFDKALPMMCSSKEMIRDVAYVSRQAEIIIDRFLPGALTLIFPKKENVADYITQGKDTIAIRMPDDEWILSLIEELGMPLLVTSANLSGTGSLQKWEDVLQQLDGRIDAIVCEDASGGQASTILDVSKEEIRILREGPIHMEEIKETIYEETTDLCNRP